MQTTTDPGVLNAVVVDDEPLARQYLRQLINDCARIRIVGECANGADAITVIRQRRPDVVFLDVQMPGMGGLDVARRIDAQSGAQPRVIFVTAHERFATAAFEVEAVDYLLKPFDAHRFARTVQRLTRHQGSHPSAERDGTFPGRMLIHHGGERVVIPTDEIEWIRAAGNYCRIRARNRIFVHRMSLSRAERRLVGGNLRRVHRSAMVNLEFIESVRPTGTGDYTIHMTSGDQVRMSRTYAGTLRDLE